MSGYCQISSSAGPSQKCQIFSQIFNTTPNFWMLSNFILRRSRVVKSLNFEPNVWRNWKFLDCAKFHPLHVVSSQNVSFELVFDTNQNFLILQNFILSRSGVVKLSISSQIFNATENFWILPNFILCRSAVVKNCFFEPNFQHKSKFFLILQNFILCRSGVVKLSISSQIFNATENFWILPNFILHRSGVVKNLIFEPNFQHKSKFFWILSNFILPGLLRGYCTTGPYFWRLCVFSQKIKQLRTKYPMDLVRNVPRNSKITVLLQ